MEYQTTGWLSPKLKQLEAENARLNNEVVKLREELALSRDLRRSQAQVNGDLSEQLAAAQATIEQMREALGNLLCRAETEYQALTDGEHGNFFEFPEAKFATATYHTISLDALHEARAEALERADRIFMQMSLDLRDTTLRLAYGAARDVLKNEAAAHRARKQATKEEGK